MMILQDVEGLNIDKLPNISVLTGEDLGQFSYMKNLILERIHYDPTSLNMSYFDLSETDYEEIALDLESLSFFSNEKIIILDHFLDLTTQKKAYLTPDNLKQFEKYVKNPISETRLIIFAPGKLDGKKRLVKRLKKTAKIFEVQPLTERELRSYIQLCSQKLSLNFDDEALDELLIKSNYDFSTCLKNLALIEAYKTNGPISKHDIDIVIPKSLQDNVFDLTKLILKRKVDEIRELLNDLHLQGEDDIKLIAIILGQLRLFLQVKLLESQGKNEKDIVSNLSTLLGRKINPYQVRFALRDARQLTPSFLQDSLSLLIETDYQIKMGLYDKEYLLEIALLKIISQMT